MAYASGTITFACKDVVFVNFILIYYRQVLGLSGTLTGVALLIALLSDGISDPMMGSISDRFRSRWGRRHPFMVIAPLPLAFCFLALLNPPDGIGEHALFLWLIATSVALRTSLTVFYVPFLALGAELSPDYHERTSITTYRATAGWIVGVTLTAFTFAVLLADVGDVDGRLVADNYAKLGTVCFFLVLICSFLCIFFTRKRIPHLVQPKDDGQSFGLRQVLSDLRIALANRNFRILFASMLTSYVLLGVLPAVMTHMGTYFWEFSATQLGLVGLSMLVPNVIVFAIMGPLARRMEKYRLLQLAFIGFGANLAWFIGLRLLGVLPENGHNFLVVLFVIYTFFQTCFMMLIHIIPSSMMADIADELEYETGERQEGILLAAQGLAQKSVSGIGVFVGGMVLDFVKMPEDVMPGDVAPEVLFKLGLIVGPILGVLFIIPFIIANRLSLTRAKHAEIQDALRERNGGNAAPVGSQT